MRTALLLLVIALAGCAQARPTRPDGIVSLNPCSDAVLAQVAPDKLVAVSHYSHNPRQASMIAAVARRWPAVGENVEEIVASGAHTVVASRFLAPATLAALQRLGLKVVLLDTPATVEGSIAQVKALAELGGNPGGGTRLADQIAQSARADVVPPIAALVWQSGELVPGDASLIADLMRRAGLANAAAARGLGQGSRLPLEALLADPPRVLIVAAENGDTRTLQHPALRSLPSRRFAFDPRLLYCGGPTIPRAMARLRAIRAAAE